MAKRRLKDRRKIVIRFYALITALLLSVVFGGGVYGMWRPEVRATSISVSGADITPPRSIGEKVEEVLAGSYFYIFPRDNIFLIPKDTIEGSILESFPRIEAAAIEQTGFNSIEVSVVERIPAFMWCEEATSTPCFASDKDGFLFALAEGDLTPLYGRLTEDAPPIGNTVFQEGAVAKVSALSDALSEINHVVTSIAFREPDEVLLQLSTGPRIEYVLGEEDEIAEAFPTVLQGIDVLEDIEYIDMRFGKRVYIRRNE